MLAGLICRIVGHRINRRRVKYDEMAFRTHCARCDASLVREPDGWHEVRN